MSTAPLVEVEDIAVHLPVGGAVLRAVDGVSFSIRRGETLGLIGESGPPHRRTFEVEVLVGGEGVARAEGRSKKEAAQAAAKLALDLLAR